MAQTDLGDQALKAGAIRGGGPRASEILIDDDDLLAAPAKVARAVRQAVLEPGRLAVVFNLPKGRLADIDDRLAVAVTGLHLLRKEQPARREFRVRAHHPPPARRSSAAGPGC